MNQPNFHQGTKTYALTPEWEKRLWEKIRKRSRDECWPWLGAFSKRGRGYIGIPYTNTTTQACRVAYMSFYRKSIPENMCVCHSCDNPNCCNPRHLSLGSHRTNLQDAARKGLMASGERNGRAKLNWKKVHEIRSSNETLAVLARRYGVGISTVWHVRHDKWLRPPDRGRNHGED